MYHYAATHRVMENCSSRSRCQCGEITEVTVVWYIYPRSWGLLFVLSSPLSSEQLILLIANDSIKDLTKRRQAALHHSLLPWNELCLFKAKGLHRQRWETTASPFQKKKKTMARNTLHFLVSFGIIRILYTSHRHPSRQALCIFSLNLSASQSEPVGNLQSKHWNLHFNDFWRVCLQEKKNKVSQNY